LDCKFNYFNLVSKSFL